MTSLPVTAWQSTERPLAHTSRGGRDAGPAASPRDRAATGSGATRQLWLPPGSSGYHRPARLLPCPAADTSQVRQSQAFPWTESNHRTAFGLGEILHPGPIQDLIFFPGIEGIAGRRVKTSGNTGEMPLDEVCCCLLKIPGLKAESTGAGDVLPFQQRAQRCQLGFSAEASSKRPKP